MYQSLSLTIQELVDRLEISSQRKEVLDPLVDYIQSKFSTEQSINLNFICTHNSRRSHLAQAWAQVAAEYYNVRKIICYSGGTEVRAMHPMVVRVLISQGFTIFNISEGINPVYAIKYGENHFPIIGFSKKYDHSFNPCNNFAAIMTCSEADGGCPFIVGAEKRIPLTFDDPKESDGKANQKEVYFDRSLEIAKEMFYVFSQVKK